MSKQDQPQKNQLAEDIAELSQEDLGLLEQGENSEDEREVEVLERTVENVTEKVSELGNAVSRIVNGDNNTFRDININIGSGEIGRALGESIENVGLLRDLFLEIQKGHKSVDREKNKRIKDRDKMIADQAASLAALQEQVMTLQNTLSAGSVEVNVDNSNTNTAENDVDNESTSEQMIEVRVELGQDLKKLIDDYESGKKTEADTINEITIFLNNMNGNETFDITDSIEDILQEARDMIKELKDEIARIIDDKMSGRTTREGSDDTEVPTPEPDDTEVPTPEPDDTEVPTPEPDEPEEFGLESLEKDLGYLDIHPKEIYESLEDGEITELKSMMKSYNDKTIEEQGLLSKIADSDDKGKKELNQMLKGVKESLKKEKEKIVKFYKEKIKEILSIKDLDEALDEEALDRVSENIHNMIQASVDAQAQREFALLKVNSLKGMAKKTFGAMAVTMPTGMILGATLPGAFAAAGLTGAALVGAPIIATAAGVTGIGFMVKKMFERKAKNNSEKDKAKQQAEISKGKVDALDELFAGAFAKKLSAHISNSLREQTSQDSIQRLRAYEAQSEEIGEGDEFYFSDEVRESNLDDITKGFYRNALTQIEAKYPQSEYPDITFEQRDNMAIQLAMTMSQHERAEDESRKQIEDIKNNNPAVYEFIQRYNMLSAGIPDALPEGASEKDRSWWAKNKHMVFAISMGTGAGVAVRTMGPAKIVMGAIAGASFGAMIGEDLAKRKEVKMFEKLDGMLAESEQKIRDIEFPAAELGQLRQDSIDVKSKLEMGLLDNNPLLKSRAENFIHNVQKVELAQQEALSTLLEKINEDTEGLARQKGIDIKKLEKGTKLRKILSIAGGAVVGGAAAFFGADLTKKAGSLLSDLKEPAGDLVEGATEQVDGSDMSNPNEMATANAEATSTIVPNIEDMAEATTEQVGDLVDKVTNSSIVQGATEQASDLMDKAGNLAEKVGDSSVVKSAIGEADNLMDKAIETAEKVGDSSIVQGATEQASDLMDKAGNLAEKVGDSSVVKGAAEQVGNAVDKAGDLVDEITKPVETIVEVVKGDSVWSIAEKGLIERLGEDKWAELGEAKQTYIIDAIKDKILDAPGDYGIDGNPDLLDIGDKIDIGKVLGETGLLDGIQENAANLTADQMANIEANNDAIASAAKSGIHITSENVDQISAEVREHGLGFITKDGQVHDWSVDGKAIDRVGDNFVYAENGKAVDNNLLANVVDHKGEKIADIPSVDNAESGKAGVEAADVDTTELSDEALQEIMGSNESTEIESYLKSYISDKGWTGNKVTVFLSSLRDGSGKINNSLGGVWSEDLNTVSNGDLDTIMGKWESSVVKSSFSDLKGTEAGHWTPVKIGDDYHFAQKAHGGIYPFRSDAYFIDTDGDLQTEGMTKISSSAMEKSFESGSLPAEPMSDNSSEVGGDTEAENLPKGNFEPNPPNYPENVRVFESDEAKAFMKEHGIGFEDGNLVGIKGANNIDFESAGSLTNKGQTEFIDFSMSDNGSSLEVVVTDEDGPSTTFEVTKDGELANDSLVVETIDPNDALQMEAMGEDAEAEDLSKDTSESNAELTPGGAGKINSFEMSNGNKIGFEYNSDGSVRGMRMEGTMSGRGTDLLEDGWGKKVVQEWNDSREGDLQMNVDKVRLTARDLQMKVDLLHGMEVKGQGDTPEANFLRDGIQRNVDRLEARYGDIVKDIQREEIANPEDLNASSAEQAPETPSVSNEDMKATLQDLSKAYFKDGKVYTMDDILNLDGKQLSDFKSAMETTITALEQMSTTDPDKLEAYRQIFSNLESKKG